jgi:hypothetical protein
VHTGLEVPTLILLFAPLAALVLLYLAARKFWPKAQNDALLTLGLSALDVASDLLLAHQIFGAAADEHSVYYSRLAAVLVAALLVDLLINTLALVRVVRAELQRRPADFSSYLSAHTAVVGAVFTLAATNINCALALDSGLFGMAAFRATLSPEARRTVAKTGLLSNVSEAAAAAVC